MSYLPLTAREFLGVLCGIFLAGIVVDQYFVPVEHWGRWISQKNDELVAKALEGHDRYKELFERAEAAGRAHESEIASLRAEVEKQKEQLAEAEKKIAGQRKKPAQPASVEMTQNQDVYLSNNSAELLFGGSVVVTWLAADDRSCRFRIADESWTREVTLNIGQSVSVAAWQKEWKMILRSVSPGFVGASACMLSLTN